MGTSLRTAMLAVVLAIASFGSTAADAAPDEDEQVALLTLRHMLAGMFELPSDPGVDESLRDAAAQIAKAHRERMDGVFRQWLAEERKRPERARTSQRLLARLANEAALWRLDSPGPDYDAVIVRALLHPLACRTEDDDSHYSAHIRTLQVLGDADRAVALTGERELLERWAKPRPGLPIRPAPSQNEMELRLLDQVRLGKAQGLRPMPPVLAARAWGDSAQAPWLLCLRHQWGLAVALDVPGTKLSDALTAYRYASAIPVAAVLAPPPVFPNGDYPPYAAAYAVQGSVRVSVTNGPDGRFKEARIVERRVRVDGIDDVPPVAFELLFDEASLARAAKTPLSGDTTRQADGSTTGSMEIVWKLQ